MVGQLLQSVAQVRLVDYVVAQVDRLGFVPGQLHGDRAGDARAFEVPHGRTSEVVQDPYRQRVP